MRTRGHKSARNFGIRLGDVCATIEYLIGRICRTRARAVDRITLNVIPMCALWPSRRTRTTTPWRPAITLCGCAWCHALVDSTAMLTDPQLYRVVVASPRQRGETRQSCLSPRPGGSSPLSRGVLPSQTCRNVALDTLNFHSDAGTDVPLVRRWPWRCRPRAHSSGSQVTRQTAEPTWQKRVWISGPLEIHRPECRIR